MRATNHLCYKNPQRNAHRLRSRAGSLYCHNSSSLRHKYALSRYKYASMSPVRAPKSLLPRCIIRDLQIRKRGRLRGGDLIDLKFFSRAFPLTVSSLSFSSDLVREVHARASVPLPSRAFSHARGHFRVSCDLLEGLRTRSLCILKKDTKKSFILIFCHHKS